MLEVRGVSKRYGSIHALTDVTLAAGPGEIVAVVGENGAGKSTLVRCIARAIGTDSGSVRVDGVELGRTPRDAIGRGVSVVWQDLALCENLDVTANLFLGRELEARGALRAAAMHARAAAVFGQLGVVMPELDRPIERLSGGQRQLVAIARATLDRPKVLVLDEPTAALGIAESRTVLGVVRTLQGTGVTIVLVSHQLDEVFDIADRIVVLRHGRVVADLHRAESHPDDVIALITGADVDSIAGQQLRRLHSLAEQLSEADQSAVLPLTVSSLSGALSVERLAIFLVAETASETATAPTLRLSASLNLPAGLARDLGEVPVGVAGGYLATATIDRSLVVVAELGLRAGDPVARRAAAHGLVGSWAAPIVGQEGTLAVIAGFSDTVTQLQPDQVQLLELFSSIAGVAIERARLVETLRIRNRSLEGLRGVLEQLAGPDLLRIGMSTALEALCRGVTCDAAALLVNEGPSWVRRALATLGGAHDAAAETALGPALDPRCAGPGVVVVEYGWSRGRAALACWWADGRPSDDADQVLPGAANSFRLAMERELTLEAEREAAAMQRSRETERQLFRRLGHELRTPLTAIRGFASTMLQPDVAWPEPDKQRFLTIIERESGRMGRLVAQLFDETAIESGTLRLEFDYCDLVAIIEHAVSIAAPAARVTVALPPSLTVWGDRDRLEQVFVNLIANAVDHNPDGTPVRVAVGLRSPVDPLVTVSVRDDGRGLPADAVDYLNGADSDRREDHGLGLRLVRGFVQAHGGSLRATTGPGTRIDISLPVEPAPG